jgi:putative ABC transport system substrate-binding protein
VLGGAVAWPLTARGQQGEQMRHIGVLLPAPAGDPGYQAWVAAFLQKLQELGWIDGRNVRIDTRWATVNPAGIRKQAAELAALTPDVILAPGTSTVRPLLQATRTVPIMFPIIADPVSGGLVDSLARPGGNATGFMLFEYSISGKWLELRKQIAPDVKHVAVLARERRATWRVRTHHEKPRPAMAGGAHRQALWLILPDSEALQQLRTAGIQAEGVVDATGLVGAAGPGLDRAVRPF